MLALFMVFVYPIYVLIIYVVTFECFEPTPTDSCWFNLELPDEVDDEPWVIDHATMTSVAPSQR